MQQFFLKSVIRLNAFSRPCFMGRAVGHITEAADHLLSLVNFSRHAVYATVKLSWSLGINSAFSFIAELIWSKRQSCLLT